MATERERKDHCRVELREGRKEESEVVECVTVCRKTD